MMLVRCLVLYRNTNGDWFGKALETREHGPYPSAQGVLESIVRDMRDGSPDSFLGAHEVVSLAEPVTPA